MNIKKVIRKYREKRKDLVTTFTELAVDRWRNGSDDCAYTFTVTEYSEDACRAKSTTNAGVYIFEADLTDVFDQWSNAADGGGGKAAMKAWLAHLDALFGAVDYAPRLYPSRVAAHLASGRFRDGFVPLYVGKSKNVFDRVHNHYAGNRKGTYGLRLSARPAVADLPFRVTSVELAALADEELYPLVAEVEKELRARLSPIMGSQ